MQEKLNIAVFVDYDNIEIGLKSTLRREFDVSLALDALKERGDIVAKFAYANWGRQDGATRQMAENAVQMVQRIPSPRGDKNGAPIFSRPASPRHRKYQGRWSRWARSSSMEAKRIMPSGIWASIEPSCIVLSSHWPRKDSCRSTRQNQGEQSKFS